MQKVRPKKSLGQHFLTDIPIAERIASTVDEAPGLPILEVGPGTGVLTRPLLKRGRELKAVEIDRESIAWLRDNMPELGDRLIEGDFLRMPLGEVFSGRPFVLTGNYPYNISSQIFFRLPENRDIIPLCTGMIQREVALRLSSPPGSRDYGILSVMLQAWYDINYLFTVEPSAFNPPPKVRSAVISMKRNGRTSLGCNEKLFKRIVKGTFLHRRKMLRVTLRSILADLDAATEKKKDHSAFLASTELTRRPETLSVDEFAALTNAVARECGLTE